MFLYRTLKSGASLHDELNQLDIGQKQWWSFDLLSMCWSCTHPSRRTELKFIGVNKQKAEPDANMIQKLCSTGPFLSKDNSAFVFVGVLSWLAEFQRRRRTGLNRDTSACSVSCSSDVTFLSVNTSVRPDVVCLGPLGPGFVYVSVCACGDRQAEQLRDGPSTGRSSCPSGSWSWSAGSASAASGQSNRLEKSWPVTPGCSSPESHTQVLYLYTETIRIIPSCL